MTRQEIIKEINTYLINKLDVDNTIITPETELKRDMGLTSLDAIDMVLYISRTFGVLLQEQDIKTIITLEDLYDCIEKHQA